MLSEDFGESRMTPPRKRKNESDVIMLFIIRTQHAHGWTPNIVIYTKTLSIPCGWNAFLKFILKVGRNVKIISNKLTTYNVPLKTMIILTETIYLKSLHFKFRIIRILSIIIIMFQTLRLDWAYINKEAQIPNV